MGIKSKYLDPRNCFENSIICKKQHYAIVQKNKSGVDYKIEISFVIIYVFRK